MWSGSALRQSPRIARGPVVSHCAAIRGTPRHGSCQKVRSHRAVSPRTDRSRGSVVGPRRTTPATRASRCAAATTTWQLCE
jgi:hypothetical protein